MKTYLRVIAYALVSTGVFLGIYGDSVAHAGRAAAPAPRCCESAKARKSADVTSCEKEDPSPKISFESTVSDLGQVGLSTKNACEFKFKNTGQAPLKITNVKTLSVF